MIELYTLDDYAQYLNKRPACSHKGDFGRVLIIGGYSGLSGSVLLAGKAAMRVGAGSVTVATHPDHAKFLATYCPELMCSGITDAHELQSFLNRSTVIVIGPGLGQHLDWSLPMLQAVLSVKDKPVVYDADALNLLAYLNCCPASKLAIYTPHPLEASRLLDIKTEDIQQDREQAIRQLQQRLGGVVILKGHETLVFSSEGPVHKCKAGNPGMATAGMGDVLSGVVGGLLAQKIPLIQASYLGVLVHALAGDAAALQIGQRGLMASDVINLLPNIVNAL